jgi:L-rhamnose-H+ transport protein
MNTNLIPWLGLLLAGIVAGSFAIPSKKVKELSWNQSWLNFSLSALLLLPIGVAAILAPDILGVLSSAPGSDVAEVAGYGFLWGIGALFFGLAIKHSGFAVANTLVCGLVACVGSAGPLVAGSGKLAANEIPPLLIGLGVLCAGIGLTGYASHIRGGDKLATEKTGSATLGLIFCVLSGGFSGMINFAFGAGEGLAAESTARGVHPALITLSIWIPALFGGFLINAGNSVFQMIRAGETERYKKAPASDWVRGFAMGTLWFLALTLYGTFSLQLGAAGGVFGFPTYMGISIATSAVWGFSTVEWKTAPQRARRFMMSGVALCVAAFVVLAVGRS